MTPVNVQLLQRRIIVLEERCNSYERVYHTARADLAHALLMLRSAVRCVQGKDMLTKRDLAEIESDFSEIYERQYGNDEQAG